MSQLQRLLAERRPQILAAWERSARLLHGSAPMGKPFLADQIATMLDSLGSASGGVLQLPWRLDRSVDLAQVILEIETLRTCIIAEWQRAEDGSVSLRERRTFDQVFDTTISDAIQRYSRARAHGSPSGLAFGAANAGRLVRDVLAEYEHVAEQKGIKLRGIDELLGADLMCDRDRITQVFGSILGNAIRICRSGDEILVRSVVGETEARFAISDSGPGLTAQDLAQVFEAASGLELYLCKGIIDAHHGTLWAESSLGDGTTVFFTLPLAR